MPQNHPSLYGAERFIVGAKTAIGVQQEAGGPERTYAQHQICVVDLQMGGLRQGVDTHQGLAMLTLVNEWVVVLALWTADCSMQ